MKMNARLLPVGACALMLVLAGSGCGKAKPPAEAAPDAAPAAEAPAEDPLAEIFMQVDQFGMQGATNEAVLLLEESLSNPALADHRQPLFNGLLRFLLFTDQIEGAQRRMLDACRADPPLAVGSMGLVYGYLMDRGDLTNVVDWTEQVLAVEPLPGEVRRNMREWNLLAYLALRDDGKMLELVDQLVKDAPAGGAAEILSRAIDTLFDQRRLDAVDQVVRQMGRHVTSDAGTRNLMLYTRVRLLATRSEWDALQAAMPDAAARLPDGELQRLLRHVFSLAQAAKLPDVIDAVGVMIIDGHQDKTQSLVTAGRQWVDATMQRDASALPDRLSRLQQSAFPVRQLCGLYMRYFYDVIDMPATVEAMKTLGNRLAPLAEDDDTRNSIRTMVLDAAFVREDYATALEILEKGIAGRDAAWHAMAISKVRAHQALQADKPREAVKYFREFMATISTSPDEATSDPATGLMHSRAMILGRNAKRIGDVLAKIPDAEAARKAYAEARDFYQKALADEKDPEVVKLINAELAEVP